MEGVSGAGGAGGADKEYRLPEELRAAKITRSFGDGALKRADK